MLDLRKRLGDIYYSGSAASCSEQGRGAVIFHSGLATGGRPLGPFTGAGGRPSCKRPTWLRGLLVPVITRRRRAWLRTAAVFAPLPHTNRTSGS